MRCLLFACLLLGSLPAFALDRFQVEGYALPNGLQLMLKPGTSWVDVYRRCVDVAPEAFHQDRVLNLWGGRWHRDGVVAPATSRARRPSACRSRARSRTSRAGTTR